MTEQRKITCDICGEHETYEVGGSNGPMDSILSQIMGVEPGQSNRTFVKCGEEDMCKPCHDAVHEFVDPLIETHHKMIEDFINQRRESFGMARRSGTVREVSFPDHFAKKAADDQSS